MLLKSSCQYIRQLCTLFVTRARKQRLHLLSACILVVRRNIATPATADCTHKSLATSAGRASMCRQQLDLQVSDGVVTLMLEQVLLSCPGTRDSDQC